MEDFDVFCLVDHSMKDTTEAIFSVPNVRTTTTLEIEF